MVTITVTKFGESQNPSPNLVKKIALFYSQYTLVFLPHTIIFWLLGHSCCPLWSPTQALCLPNKGNHRDTRLVHKGDLQYIHTLFVKLHSFLGLRLSFFAGVGNFSYILRGWEWCVAQLSGWHSLCLMHYTAQFWQGRISFFISYLLLFHLLSFHL